MRALYSTVVQCEGDAGGDEGNMNLTWTLNHITTKLLTLCFHSKDFDLKDVINKIGKHWDN